MSTRIRFAGAFGSFIDPKYAMVLGLIPDCDLDKVKAVGNAAGTGALMALLNRDHRREIEQTVSKIEKIETALEPNFQEHFINAMALPNKVDPFPNLAAAVTLPPRKADSEGSGRRADRGAVRAKSAPPGAPEARRRPESARRHGRQRSITACIIHLYTNVSEYRCF